MARSKGYKKNLIVVAVSSPYDFSLDKSLGTYICTYDFTDDAMHALVRTLMGESKPRGSIPGTMRKARRSMKSKSKQFWLVEEYNSTRDGTGLDALIALVARASSPEMPYLETSSAGSFVLANPNIQEGHFVVRNSSKNEVYGFVATYVIGSTGIIGGLFVDPNKRNLSIGRSLHRRAMRSLIQNPNITKMQLGTVLPAIFLGIPVGAEESSSVKVKEWFASAGWDVQFPRRLTTMAIPQLGAWTAQEGLLQSIQRAGLSFDLIYGPDNGDGVLALVAAAAAADANPEVAELYRAALSQPSCGVVRAKAADESLVGCVVVARRGSGMAHFVPSLVAPHGEEVAGILAPISAQGPQAALVLQGLALMGVRQAKMNKATKVVLSWVSPLFAPRGFPHLFLRSKEGDCF
jgi:beta-N-acetylhexosaminidase